MGNLGSTRAQPGLNPDAHAYTPQFLTHSVNQFLNSANSPATWHLQISYRKTVIHF